MLVPAKKQKLTRAQIDQLKVGDKVNVDSGLGGSYALVIATIENETYYLVCKMKNHEHKYEFLKNELAKNIYALVPDRSRF